MRRRRHRSPAWPALAILLGSVACDSRAPELPEKYRRLEIPSQVLASPSARERGAALYHDHCAICHGERGDGQGVRREGLTTPPRDFTDPEWHRRVTPGLVYYRIREGVRRTAMPAWSVLSEEESWDLVAFLLSLGKEKENQP